jgi:hypothetical protein
MRFRATIYNISTFSSTPLFFSLSSLPFSLTVRFYFWMGLLQLEGMAGGVVFQAIVI